MGNEKSTEVVVTPQTPAVLQGKPADIVINQFADLVEKGQLFFPDIQCVENVRILSDDRLHYRIL